MKVTIHQPNYLPWLGFFNKVSKADILVILDSVQYEKGGFTNRNKIKISSSQAGWIWLTVPVNKVHRNQLIKDVEIDNTKDWKEYTLRVITAAYKKAPYYNTYYNYFEKIYTMDWNKLSELNIYIIQTMLNMFNFQPRIIQSSNFFVEGKKSELILDICKKLGATTYVSGISGKEYLDTISFNAAGIEIETQEYKHPIYRQIGEPFIPNMSALDLLFNYGAESSSIIRMDGHLK